jgi:hypothetical protein
VQCDSRPCIRHGFGNPVCDDINEADAIQQVDQPVDFVFGNLAALFLKNQQAFLGKQHDPFLPFPILRREGGDASHYPAPLFLGANPDIQAAYYFNRRQHPFGIPETQRTCLRVV